MAAQKAIDHDWTFDPEIITNDIINIPLNGSEYLEDFLMHPNCPLFGLLEVFNKYYTPFIILVGLLGNFLACVVFLTTHLKVRSSSYYLAALAVSDFGFLTMLLLVYLSNTAVLEIYNRPGWCQTIVYISSVCGVLSVWLIVAFTVERFIAVQYPLQRPQICTVSRAKTIILVIVIIAMISQSYTFVTAGMVKRPNLAAQCDMVEEHFNIMQTINIIDTIVALIGPFILIVVMNTMIARNLFMFRKRLHHRTLDDCLPSTDRSDVHLHEIQCVGRNSRRTTSQQSQSSNSRAVNCRFEQPPVCIYSGRHFATTKNQQNITKMLLLISSVFILLNLTSYVIRIYVFFFFSLWEENPPTQLWCLQQFFMLLYYTNFSINFLLYAMCGITFRRCLSKLMRKNLKAITRHCSKSQRSP